MKFKAKRIGVSPLLLVRGLMGLAISNAHIQGVSHNQNDTAKIIKPFLAP